MLNEAVELVQEMLALDKVTFLDFDQLFHEIFLLVHLFVVLLGASGKRNIRQLAFRVFYLKEIGGIKKEGIVSLLHS